ncbi:2-hydroxy-3-oxopropionate reductase [Amycolatopsis sp.]|uniref:2-hydroxy-3-oxopropionate reductase n=1 Tax=Amycolatopsis sp. TaxID=37632 RepID=UPI0026317C72|nr:2-hydroxy-3-oxopropionate reductase [Amycolatopsis sp.]
MWTVTSQFQPSHGGTVPERARIGFIGLGVMGLPMAANLVMNGFEVIGHNRSRSAVDKLAALGGRVGQSVADVTRNSDVVITMLPDSPDVEAVALGENGIIDTAQSGQLYIDMSTISPRTAVAVADAAATRGIRALDAPVSGGEQGAIDGTLSIMCGGDASTVELAQPVLRALGTTIVHVGPSGSGQIVKAANQLVVAGTIELVAEAIVLLEASGVDATAGLSVLAGGLAGNRILDRKAASMLARDFSPGFRIDLHHKDLQIALAVAEQVKAVIPVGALVSQLLAAVRAQGDGALDHSALLKLTERLSGRRND